MSILKRLFGGGAAEKSVHSEEYEGFKVTPSAMKDGTKWRLCAQVEKEVGGELKTHQLIRADTFDTADAADAAAIAKARQLIDQMGDKLF